MLVNYFFFLFGIRCWYMFLFPFKSLFLCLLIISSFCSVFVVGICFYFLLFCYPFIYCVPFHSIRFELVLYNNNIKQPMHYCYFDDLMLVMTVFWESVHHRSRSRIYHLVVSSCHHYLNLTTTGGNWIIVSYSSSCYYSCSSLLSCSRQQ